MPSKLSKFDSLDTLKNADMTQQETAEDLMYGVAETGNLEKAAELFQDLLTRQNNTFMDFDFNNFPKPAANYPKLISAAICNVLGVLCILLNVFVVLSLLRNRKRVLTNVFYVLVLHCAFVDLIRGGCLVTWSIPHLLINSLQSMQNRLLVLKINQFTLVILRSCNLLTIFNLLVFTTNEFIVIKFPLHYRRYFRRRTVLVILACSWLISLFFAVGSVFSNYFASAHSVMVRNNGTATSLSEFGEGVTRRQIGSLSINIICMLMIFVLCYLCLVIVLVCYGTILKTIRQFHSGTDTKGRFHSEESQKFNRNTIRNVEINKEGKTSIVVPPNSSIDTPGNCTNDPQQQPCNSHRKWRSHLMSRHKYLIVIGSVLFVDILFLFPYSGIQLVAFLHLNNVLITPARSSLIRWILQILIGVHSVFQPLCYFRMNEFRRLACCFDQTKISRSKSFSQDIKSIGCSEGQSRENERETNTPGAHSHTHSHHFNRRKSEEHEGSVTDPTAKRYPKTVRRLSRLMSRGLLDSSSDSSCECQDQQQNTQLVPTVEIDPERAHTPTASELEHILDCGLQSPFLSTNWNRVVGASLRFRQYPDQHDEPVRPKLSTLSDMRSSTCFERESICLPDEPEQ